MFLLKVVLQFNAQVAQLVKLIMERQFANQILLTFSVISRDLLDHHVSQENDAVLLEEMQLSAFLIAVLTTVDVLQIQSA